MQRCTTTVLWLVAATLLLAGCGSSPTDAGAEAAESGNSSKTRATPSATGQWNFIPTPTDSAAGRAPRIPFGTGPQVVKNKGAWDLVLRDVRVGQHDSFERVVLEFAGSGRPGWDARYVNTPKADGSGEVVVINGDSFLGIAISG